jgi:bifunctional non-homologous end joining protein LigD
MPPNVQPFAARTRVGTAFAVAFGPRRRLDETSDMALERYREKRDFRITPEPKGDSSARRSGELAFVIQKHAATRLHYDFRLELNGVLLSWAVPKGPSLDPNDKRLAMHVEDHPIEYGEFEGVIPPKQYGAGTVMVWDRGTWTPKGSPEDGYAKGHLKFELRGEKLKGTWNLVKSRSGKYGGDSWLLFKESDEFARLGPQAHIVDERPDSALTGRSLAEIAAQKDRVWHSNRSVEQNVEGGAIRKRNAAPARELATIEGARKSPIPDLVDAQLATSTKSPPTGASWVHEIKYDGYRMLCRIVDGDVRMMSRSAKDWTADFPSVTRSLARLPVESAWLDGEVVVVDAEGRSDFQALQNALSGTNGTALTYVAFDLLYLDGFDLRGVALAERKRILKQLASAAPANIKYSEHFSAPGDAFLANVRALGLEGMVSKRADLRYQPGRGAAWRKVKCERSQEMVIGGFTDPEGSRQGFGALMLGVYETDGRLAYAGKVGTGFNEQSLASLHAALEKLVQKASPFHNPPTGAEARRAHFVTPVLVADVAFTEWTADGTLRHPKFLRLRTDKPAAAVVREEQADDDGARHADEPRAKATARSAKARANDDRNVVAGVALTNPDKLLYAEAKLTKRDLALYYAAVGERMLPHLLGRPLTLVRCPNGWDQKCFYQKNVADGVPESISRIKVASGDDGDSIYMMAESVTAIVALLQLGVLEIHPWGSRKKALGLPDRLIFDLDPDESLPWESVRQAVLVVKTLLETIGLVPFLKTTGGKGLHVVVPVEPSVNWDQAKGFTKAIAELLETTFPDRFTSKLLKVSRRDRIFIDYLRNAEGSTAVAAYSLRAKANAPVSLPIGWEELADDVRFAHFDARNVPKRLAKTEDPWRRLADSERPLTTALMAKVGYAAR